MEMSRHQFIRLFSGALIFTSALPAVARCLIHTGTFFSRDNRGTSRTYPGPVRELTHREIMKKAGQAG